MSKIIKRIKRRKIIKRLRGVVLILAIVASVFYIKGNTEKRSGAEKTEIKAEAVHIKERSVVSDAAGQQSQQTPRTYADVEFVALPVPMTETDQRTVFQICKEYGVAFPLVMAIIERESQFDRAARSSTGDSGYMQINDINAGQLAEMGFTDLYDPEQNVRAGVYILSELFAKHEGDTTFVLMAYNAGERGAREMRDGGIYETEYTAAILSRADDFSSYIDESRKE